MFHSSGFSQPIGDWDASKVNSFLSMFGNFQFNQPIGNWNVSGGNDFASMFMRTPYNHDLSTWDVTNAEVEGMFRDTPYQFDYPKGCTCENGCQDLDDCP